MLKRMLKRLCIFMLMVLPLALNADIYTLRIDGPIESITEEYVVNTFNKIKSEKPQEVKLVVLLMDTPGGFDTSMRSIIKAILDSPVPVAVYVSPKGARAASAGFFITVAVDIAAMAPGTNTGAAHPVSVGGEKIDDTMNEKITNDAVSYIKSLAKSRNRNIELAEKAVRESKSFTAEECLKENLIEYIADDLAHLLKQLEGKEIHMSNGKTVVMKLEGDTIIEIPMSHRQEFLKTITNPNLAYFLLIFGLIGLYLEFSHPGMIVPGVLGGISLLLAFLAFQILPINYIGLLLILLSIGFFIAEVKIQGFGAFGVGGIVAFLLGSIMLVDSPIPEMRPAMSMIIIVSIGFAAILFFLTYKVLQAMQKKPETGLEGLVGETGVAKTDITTESGKVFVHGEWWNAISVDESSDPISSGTQVSVVSMNNFVLSVKKKSLNNV